jgi:hypothetical protein
MPNSNKGKQRIYEGVLLGTAKNILLAFVHNKLVALLSKKPFRGNQRWAVGINKLFDAKFTNCDAIFKPEKFWNWKQMGLVLDGLMIFHRVKN